MNTYVRFILLFTLLISQVIAVNATSQIDKNHNSIRINDVLHKTQVNYKDPGRNGCNVIWDFSYLRKINDDYIVKYIKYTPFKTEDSVISCIEHNTKYFYTQKNDSVLYHGFENSSTKITFSDPQLILRYPFNINDSLFKEFCGTGVYMNTLHVDLRGVSTTFADATGTIILPDGDTVKNAIRTKQVLNYSQISYPFEFFKINEDSLNNGAIDSLILSSSDTLNLKTEIYRWYSKGYRYPIFETIHNKRHNNNDSIEIADISTSFYFPKSLHTYLKDDIQNKIAIDSLISIAEKEKNQQEKDRFDYNCYPNPVRSVLNVEMLLYKPSNIVLRLYNSSGNLILTHDLGLRKSGIINDVINLSGLNTGIYILDFLIGNKNAQATIVKL